MQIIKNKCGNSVINIVTLVQFDVMFCLIRCKNVKWMYEKHDSTITIPFLFIYYAFPFLFLFICVFFSFLGAVILDINECEDEPYRCRGGNCINKPGGFECQFLDVQSKRPVKVGVIGIPLHSLNLKIRYKF